MITTTELKKYIEQRKNEIKSKLQDCVIIKTQGEVDYCVTKLDNQLCIVDLDENGEVAKWQMGDNAEVICTICNRNRKNFVECLSEIDRKFNIECDDLFKGLKKYYNDEATKEEFSRFNAWALKTIAKIKKTSVDEVLEELKKKDAYNCEQAIKRLIVSILSFGRSEILGEYTVRLEPLASNIEELATILDESCEVVRSYFAEMLYKLICMAEMRTS